VLLVGLKARNTTEFEVSHLVWDPPAATPTPRVGFYKIDAVLDLIPGSPTQITLTDSRARQIAVEGALVVREQGGARYRLGTAVDPANGDWELSPDSDLVPADDDGDTVDIFIVGRGLADPALPWDQTSNPHTGPSQVVAVRAISTTLD
jgi:hypothetical protein